MISAMVQNIIKRIIDILVAGVLLILLMPIFVLIALAVAINLGSPVIFIQLRPGLNGNCFKMFKFRSMREAFDESGIQLEDSLRLTQFGRFLRATSLDELPELWNVLIGNMSLVGPRPLLVEYLPLYSPFQARRHEIRPGITGWAQVNGRNGIGWEERFALDVWYVDHHSLWLDIVILGKTVKKVFTRDGINAQGCVSMPKFEGCETTGKKL